VVSPPTGTLTFLFTEIEGSTSLWENDAPAMQAALARHDELLRRSIEERGGYVFKTVGDAFCAVFATAPDALEAALEAQRLVLKERWAESTPLRVRMALHMGAADERDGDYFGPPVNRVARLLSADHGGQVLLSLPAQELVRDQLPAQTSLRDLGEHRLKDLFRPERIFQLLDPELPADFPPLRTLDAYRNNLPLQPTPLVGREKEVAEICERLSRPEVRLLTLTGAGGTGKTRLGLQAAAELTQEFEDGVFFVSLAAIRDPQLVVGAVAGTLGVKEVGDQPLLENLENYLGEKRMLLLVDNFEQVLEAAPMVSEMLSAAPNLKVLATSRIPLRLYGEYEYSVPPLALPDPERPLPVERLTHYEAVRLFVERAQAARPDFSVTNDNAPAVAEICYRLDGLPLAIELAAARIKVLSPQRMLGRLSNRLKLLTGGARDLPERQRTLRSTIEWSYGLLEECEKVLFARLSEFAGGRTIEAIEAICDAGGDLPVDVLDGLTSLVDECLLKQEEGVGLELRFVMLETIHEFAREKLQESGEAEEVRRQHAEHFLALAEEADPALEGPQQPVWLERLEEEHDNIRAALSWSLGQGQDAELALRIGAALGWFWYLRGYLGEGRRWLEEALAKSSPAPRAERARALHRVSWLAFVQDDLVRAVGAGEEGLELEGVELFRAGSGDSAAADLRRALAMAVVNRGEDERATGLLKESLALSREAGSIRGTAISHWGLGVRYSLGGDIGRAREFLEEALTLSRKAGDPWSIAGILAHLGDAFLRQGDLKRATASSEEAVAMLRELKNRDYLADALDNLGWVALLQGNPERAKAVYAEGLGLRREVGSDLLIPNTLQALASTAAALGEAERAARLFGAVEMLNELSSVDEDIASDELVGPYFATARSQLDETSWQEAWAEGRAMTLEEAVSYALEGAGG
jgi:predicted ATPase/class 3 adenylate cyclase/Tfp pilus assembly protein PilF